MALSQRGRRGHLKTQILVRDSFASRNTCFVCKTLIDIRQVYVLVWLSFHKKIISFLSLPLVALLVWFLVAMLLVWFVLKPWKAVVCSPVQAGETNSGHYLRLLQHRYHHPHPHQHQHFNHAKSHIHSTCMAHCRQENPAFQRDTI